MIRQFNFPSFCEMLGVSVLKPDGTIKTFQEVYTEIEEKYRESSKTMTVIDRDEIIEFFDNDRNFHIFALLEKYGFKPGKNRDNAEAMMNELITKIYIGLLEMEPYEVDVSETY